MRKGDIATLIFGILGLLIGLGVALATETPDCRSDASKHCSFCAVADPFSCATCQDGYSLDPNSGFCTRGEMK